MGSHFTLYLADRAAGSLHLQNKSSVSCIDCEQLEQFPAVNQSISQVRFLEFSEKGNLNNLEREAKMYLQPSPDSIMTYMIYIDDLFALDDNDIDQLLGTLKERSEVVSIYLLATLPIWIFDQSDLAEKKKTFQLKDCIETPLSGIDDDDRQALRDQYLAVYGLDCRPELLAELEQSTDDLIILKAWLIS